MWRQSAALKSSFYLLEDKIYPTWPRVFNLTGYENLYSLLRRPHADKISARISHLNDADHRN